MHGVSKEGRAGRRSRAPRGSHRGQAVFASLPSALAAFAQMYGVPREGLLRAGRLEPADVQDPDELVPYECLPAMWRHLLARVPDRAIGLEYAALASTMTYGLVGRLCVHSATFGEALEHYLRFYHLLDPRLVVELDARDDRVVATIGHEPRTVAMAEPMEMIVGSMVKVMRAVYTDLPPPLRVTFSHPRRHAPAVYEGFFEAPVEFDAATTSVHIPASALSLSAETADPQLLRYLARHAETLLPGTDAGAAWHAQLFSVVEAELIHGRVLTEAEVAERMSVSLRTMQRRLHEAGASYRDVLDEVRRTIAHDLLADPERSIEEVAFRVGFTDASAFRRACRRWTKETPSQLRARLRGA